MKYLVTAFLSLSTMTAWSQIRAFDNSKAILPALYNPAADFSEDLQIYAAYDGRGTGNFMPQSIVAGLRMPMQHGRRNRQLGPSSIMGIQLLKTSQDVLKSSTLSASFAHQIALSREVRFSLGLGAGIFDMKYNYGALEYLDQHDPLLNNGENFFNFHLNAGAALVVNEKLSFNLATPYLIKDHRVNISEIIFRASYVLPVNPETNLIASANLDTYNRNLIFGGDLQLEYRKVFSVLAGADRYKFHGGIKLDVKPFAVGYTYGMNFSQWIDHVPSHQISVLSHIPLRR